VVVKILVLRLFFPARKAGDEPRRVVTVIGHGIGGIDIPAKMARLAKCKITGVSDDGPSSPDLEASQISLTREMIELSSVRPSVRPSVCV